MFYTQQQDQVICAHSLSNVLRQLTTKPTFNHVYLTNYFLRGVVFRYPNHQDTLYQNIYHVPPGHELQIINNKPVVTRTWSIDDGPPLDLPEDEILLQFKAHLLRSIQQRLPSQGHVGVELSGGLDSSSVAAFLRECLPNESIYAFTNGLPNHHCISHFPPDEIASYQFDETIFSKPVAKRLRLKQEIITDQQPFYFHQILEQYTKILGSFSEVTFPILNYRCYERAKALGITALFSGFGGDEVVTQHARMYLQELRMQKKYWRYRYERFRETNIKEWGKLHLFPRPNRQNHLLTPTDHLAFLRISMDWEKEDEMPHFSTVQSYEHALVEGVLSAHLARRVETSSIIAAHYGIQYLFPLLDPNLMQFFHRIPSHMKRRHGMGRYLMRQTVRPLLTAAVVWRRDKEGRTAAAANALFMRQLPQLFLDIVPSDYQGLLINYVDIPKLRKHLEHGGGHESGVFRLAVAAMMFVILEKWLDTLF